MNRQPDQPLLSQPGYLAAGFADRVFYLADVGLRARRLRKSGQRRRRALAGRSNAWRNLWKDSIDSSIAAGRGGLLIKYAHTIPMTNATSGIASHNKTAIEIALSFAREPGNPAYPDCLA